MFCMNAIKLSRVGGYSLKISSQILFPLPNPINHFFSHLSFIRKNINNKNSLLFQLSPLGGEPNLKVNERCETGLKNK